MKKIEIEIPEGKEAKWVDGVLILVDEPKDIERIKNLYDAIEWCNQNYREDLVEHWASVKKILDTDRSAKDVIAYLELRIITCALNEGWTPTEEDAKWYAYICGSDGKIYTDYSRSSSSFNEAEKLALKSEDLAEYAATRFKSIYKKYCGK